MFSAGFSWDLWAWIGFNRGLIGVYRLLQGFKEE